MKYQDTDCFFPYGTQYHRAPTPEPGEWAEDLREIARVGFTHIQLRPQWRWHERVRDQRTWDDLDTLFDLAASHHLRVVLKPMLETAPDWVFTELQGTRIGFHNIPISPIAHGAYYVGGWWPCFDNPRVVAAASDFVRALVARYRQHPALWCYNAWNEPVSRPLGQCQCPYSITSYRDWLQHQFGTIEQLNAALGKAWTSYETLMPPSAASDYAEMFLWRQWAGYAVAQQVRFVEQAIRAVDTDAHIMMHVSGSLVTQDPACEVSDDFQNVEHTDRYGTSFWVPMHPVTPTEHAAPEYQSSWMRRIDPAYWCHEFYPNHGNWCRPPEPRTLQRLIWLAIAGGADGLTFWQYRSERVGSETNGYGLRNIDGTPTERSRVVDGIAATLQQYGHRLRGTRRVPAQVALLYSRESDLLSRIEMMPTGIHDVSRETANARHPYKRAIRAAHALYLHLGHAPDWVVPGDDLGRFALVHVTAAEMINQDMAMWLHNYVHQGGTLVIEYPFACRDERTWVSPERPCHQLHTLTGCREGERLVAHNEDVATFASNLQLRAGEWCTELIAHGGQVIARWQDGAVAGVRYSYGEGTVITLGLNAALAYQDAWDDPSRALYAWLLGEAQVVTPPWGEGVTVLRRQGDAYEVWCVMNFRHASQSVVLPTAPTAAWSQIGCCVDQQCITMEPGAVLVMEMPCVLDTAADLADLPVVRQVVQR